MLCTLGVKHNHDCVFIQKRANTQAAFPAFYQKKKQKTKKKQKKEKNTFGVK